MFLSVLFRDITHGRALTSPARLDFDQALIRAIEYARHIAPPSSTTPAGD
jgi:hypothetical protein